MRDKLYYENRLHKLEAKGGNARLIAKIKRRLRALS